jgi:hypothetical protein
VAYEDLVKYYVLKKPYPNREGIANIIAEVAKSVPKAGLKYEDVTDVSILGETRQERLYRRAVQHRSRLLKKTPYADCPEHGRRVRSITSLQRTSLQRTRQRAKENALRHALSP